MQEQGKHEQQREEEPEEEQVATMKEAAALISEEAAADFLFLLPNLMVADPDITGLPTNALKPSFDMSRLARD